MNLQPNFDYSEWEERYAHAEGLTAWTIKHFPPPDTYRPGKTGFVRRDGRGIDQKRSLAIQRARGKKRADTNHAYFNSTVLPAIRDQLNAADWIALGEPAQGGFILYRHGERQQWIHPELQPDLIKRAEEMGAQPVTA